MGALTGNNSCRKDLISTYLQNFPGCVLCQYNTSMVAFGLALTNIGEGSTDSNLSYMRCKLCPCLCTASYLGKHLMWFRFMQRVSLGLSWKTEAQTPFAEPWYGGTPLIYKIYEHETLGVFVILQPVCSSVSTQITCASIFVNTFRT